jgi:predicted ATPase
MKFFMENLKTAIPEEFENSHHSNEAGFYAVREPASTLSPAQRLKMNLR